MKTAPTSPDHNNPTLDRVRALIALMLQFLEDPTRHLDLERLFAEAEQLLARLTFEAAARIAGRPDLLETHEAYIVSNGRRLDIRVRLKPSALHPHHRIILNRRRTARMAQYRRAMGRRSRFSRKAHLPLFPQPAPQLRRAPNARIGQRRCPSTHTIPHRGAALNHHVIPGEAQRRPGTQRCEVTSRTGFRVCGAVRLRPE